jgi:hypothetical protein
VAKALRGLAFEKHLPSLPAKESDCFMMARTPATLQREPFSPPPADIALGYVRKECNNQARSWREWLGGGWWRR